MLTAVELLLERNTNPSWMALSHNYEHELGTLTFLTNSISLKNEGNLMSHCVGGYTDKCYSGHSHIAHINLNNQEYIKGSTVEFMIDKVKDKNSNDVKE